MSFSLKKSGMPLEEPQPERPNYTLLFEEFAETQPEYPSWVRRVGKTFIDVQVSNGWEQSKRYRIRQRDTAAYPRINDQHSGIRSLGDIVGDWRQIDDLYRFCHAWFKFVDPDYYRLLKKLG